MTPRRALAGAMLFVALLLVGHGRSGSAQTSTTLAAGVAGAQPAPTSGAGEVVAGGRAPAATGAPSRLSAANAVVLGVVEGITEFLPISSTGHLLVTERLLDLPKTDALDSYTIIIQFGAILAVLAISWRRVVTLVLGLVGRHSEGRKILIALVVAFLPAAILGKAFGDSVEEHLLRPVPVASAWIVGGLAIIVLTLRKTMATVRGAATEAITVSQAAVIGVGQALALWPGTSRSLVTIVVGVLVGLSVVAAVEFSFLLGLATLSAATLYEVARHGDLVRDQIGVRPALIGVLCAFLSAVLAVKWMVGYLQRRDLGGFGYYRIAAGVLTLFLVSVNVI